MAQGGAPASALSPGGEAALAVLADDELRQALETIGFGEFSTRVRGESSTICKCNLCRGTLHRRRRLRHCHCLETIKEFQMQCTHTHTHTLNHVSTHSHVLL